MFIFRGAHVGQQHLLWRFVHHLPNYARESRITSWLAFKHAASITEFLLRTDFFCKVYWPTPFNMHFDFRPLFRITFAELSRKYPYSHTDPGHQHWRKSEDQGPWCLALAKPHFWKLGYCYSHSLVPFSCRTPGGSGWQPFTAISRGCTGGKAKTRGLGVWLSQSVTFGNLATATRILWCPSPAGPRAAVGGSPLHIMILIHNFRETFAK